MGLCTPCAGPRPGAADPPRSRAANPPPRLLVAWGYEQGDQCLKAGAWQAVAVPSRRQKTLISHCFFSLFVSGASGSSE